MTIIHCFSIDKMNNTLKEQVLKSARELFMDRSYEAVGMRDIARAVGREPVQVYRLKLSKSDILAELIIELNQEQISRLPEICSRVNGSNLFEWTCSYLKELYELDIHYLPIRSVGAAFGWLWAPSYEQRIVEQVQQLIKPLVDILMAAGLDDISARCIGIWSLYYVGYRQAVIHGGTADDCLAAIKPSLRFFLEFHEAK